MNDTSRYGIQSIGESVYGEEWKERLRAALRMEPGDFAKLANGHLPSLARKAKELEALIDDRLSELISAKHILGEITSIAPNAAG